MAEEKTCSEGYVLNTDTGFCIKIDGSVYKKLMKKTNENMKKWYMDNFGFIPPELEEKKKAAKKPKEPKATKKPKTSKEPKATKPKTSKEPKATKPKEPKAIKEKKADTQLSDTQLQFISAFKPEYHDEIIKCLTQKRGRRSEVCKRWRNRFEAFSE